MATEVLAGRCVCHALPPIRKDTRRRLIAWGIISEYDIRICIRQNFNVREFVVCVYREVSR